MQIVVDLIKKYSVGLAIIAIALFTFSAFFPTLFSGFLNFDDNVHLTENPCLDFNANNGIQDLLACQVNETYIPLTLLSFAVEKAIFGSNPFIYHLDNVLLHICVALLVFVFMRQLGLSVWWGAFAALLFSVHPMRVESVAWVTERKDVLYAVFYMAAVIVYGRYIRRIKGDTEDGVNFGVRLMYLGAVMLLGWLSVLSKAMALSLPAILFLLDWYHGRRIFSLRVILEKILVALIIEPVAWQTYIMNSRAVELSFPGSLCVWTWCFWFYPIKIFIPSETLLIYDAPKPVCFLCWPYTMCVLAFLGLLFILWAFRKNKTFVFSVMFYLFSIFFLLRMDLMSVDLNLVAPRFAYLPCLGIVFLIVKAMAHVYERIEKEKMRKVFVFIPCFFIFTYSFLSFHESLVWRSNRSIWERQLRLSHFRGKRQSIIWTKLAMAILEETGWFESLQELPFDEERKSQFLSSPKRRALAEQAMAMYHKALEENPDGWDPNFNLGRLYRSLGNRKAARYFLEKACDNKEDFYWGVFEFGMLALDEGMPIRALKIWHQAMIMSPDDHRKFHDKIVESITFVIQAGNAPNSFYKAYKDLDNYYIAHYNSRLPELEGDGGIE